MFKWRQEGDDVCNRKMNSEAMTGKLKKGEKKKVQNEKNDSEQGTHHDQENSPAEVARKINLAATNVAISMLSRVPSHDSRLCCRLIHTHAEKSSWMKFRFVQCTKALARALAPFSRI